MCVTQFTTQRQLMSKNMPADAMSGPYAQQQKMLLYVLPVVFAVGGVAFPLGVLIYWTTSNLWTMGQQFYVIRRNPAPGTPAFAAKQDRDKARGKTVAEDPLKKAADERSQAGTSRTAQEPASLPSARSRAARSRRPSSAADRRAVHNSQRRSRTSRPRIPRRTTDE